MVVPNASEVNDRRRNPRRYPPEFKLQVVREALSLPEHSRIKPTARRYPGVTPVQVRMWIKNIAALEEAAEKQRDQRAQELAQHQSSATAMPFFVPPSPKPQLIFLPSHQCGWNNPYVQNTVGAAPPAVAPQIPPSASTSMPFLTGGPMHTQQLVMPPMNGSSAAMHQFPAHVQTSPMVHCSAETRTSPPRQTSMQPSMQPPHVPLHMQHSMHPPNQHVRQSVPQQIPSLPNNNSYMQQMASLEHVISPPISRHEQTNDQQAVQDLLELARPEAPLWGL